MNFVNSGPKQSSVLEFPDFRISELLKRGNSEKSQSSVLESGFQNIFGPKNSEMADLLQNIAHILKWNPAISEIL